MEKGYDVLIVDDEPIIRKGLKKMVEVSGRPIAEIRIASSGEEALERIKESLPHFVFTDIRMSDMDGIELSKIIQQQGWPLQVVVISGFGEFQYAQKCLSYGVKEFLLKPVRSDEFGRVLDKLIDGVGISKARISLSMLEFDIGMERISDAIWYLNEDNLHSCLTDWKRYTVTLHLTMQDFIQLYQDGLDRVNKLLNQKDIYPFDKVPNLVSASNAMLDEGLVCAHFEQSIFSIFQDLQRKRKGNVIDPIKAAKDYIESHLNKEVSLEEVAVYLGLNPSYFSQLFKQTTRETFVHFRMKKRMERAQRLLHNASHRMYDIAEEVGYTDYSHFAKTFKKWFGISPTEYRSKLGID
ncbi:response regulator transcription factor [Paenibacillus nasutitermitis]|uniref:Response regulator n=1 Tax=Paenibacillus nasutitermitis TaxID=1652958 RepID=A0A916YR94_9BACL|nr:response regulator [Paenibacillus nasutitermitis]GGD56821.1 hypothetical protein GCM10010911_13210 [Paenibacillus nasutitermitis]